MGTITLKLRGLEEYFASPLTPHHVRELWSLCKEREMGDGFRMLTLNPHFGSALSMLDRYRTHRQVRNHYVENHGIEQNEADMQQLEEGRRGIIFGYRVEGEFFAHAAEPAVQAFFFQVLPKPIKVFTLAEFDSYFASEKTPAQLADLWGKFKAQEPNLSEIRVDCSESTTPAIEIYSTWEQRMPRLKSGCECYGEDEFSMIMRGLGEIRLGSIWGERAICIAAVHENEPAVLAFFFWMRPGQRATPRIGV
ncbi:hypothetical protein EON80_10725 [bacterium]|nr:MAG: hypothetical protein EON80_10725 [bacterium]